MFSIDNIFTFQSVLLSPHDVDQGALQRVHVEAVKRPGTFLQRGEKEEKHHLLLFACFVVTVDHGAGPWEQLEQLDLFTYSNVLHFLN